MQITLSAVTGGVVPFALGFAFKQGHIASGRTIAATGTDIQATVKNRWPDGSVKFAILAGTVSATAGTAQTLVLQSSTTPASGTALTTANLRATGIVASIDCGTFGTVSWSGSDWDSPATAWVSGPVMSSWIYRKAVGTDKHLVGWLEVRLFRDGAVEVLPWVENGYLNVAAPINKVADYKFTLGGTQRFSQRLDLPNHCRTPLISGSVLSYWLGTDPGVVAFADTDYLQATELVPTYFADVPASAAVIGTLPTTFTPLQQGSYPESMGSGGYDPSIGLLPEWDVLFLCSPTAAIWSAMQRNAYSAGRYGIHHRDENTFRPPRFSSYPTTVLGEGNGVVTIGSSATGTYTPTATGTVPAYYATSHHPSMGFMAYLATGRWYHMETVQFVAITNYFKSSSNPRQGASGVIQTWSSNLTRGAAWSLRSLGQAACATPDDDTPLATEFLASYAANINAHHATYVSGAQGTLGFMQPFTNYFSPVFQNAGAGSTSTSIVLPGGTSSTTGEYAKQFSNGSRWTIIIGGQTRDITAWDGPSFTATVSPAFTVPTAGQPSELHSNHWYEASWMQDFYTAAVGYTRALDLNIDAATKTRLGEFHAWKAKSVIGRFGGVGPNEYLYRDAASYTMAIAESESWSNWYSDWGKVWADTHLYNEYGPNKEFGDGSLRGSISATAYWGNLQPALAYAVRFGIAGAAEAQALMRGAPNWNTVLVPDFNQNPVWSVRAATP